MEQILNQAARYGTQIDDLWNRGMETEAYLVMRAWHAFSDQFHGSKFDAVCAAYWNAFVNGY